MTTPPIDKRLRRQHNRMHYAPHGSGIVCRHGARIVSWLEAAGLNEHTNPLPYGVGKSTTSIYRVTCQDCLREVECVVQRRLR